MDTLGRLSNLELGFEFERVREAEGLRGEREESGLRKEETRDGGEEKDNSG